MSAMYSLPSYMPAHVDPTPASVMYALPSYHKLGSELCQNGTADGELAIVDPVKLVEKKQLELIASLNFLGDKLNALLKQKGNSKPATNGKAAPAAQKETTPVTNEAEGTKKDKDSKKEARKAAKQEAKAKVASGAQETSAKGGKTCKGNNSPWTIKEEKKSTETGQALTACTKPELADFTRQDLGEVKLVALNDDIPWLNALAKLGERRGVHFIGKVTNKTSKGKSSVSVEIGDKFTISFKEGSVRSRVTAWEVLGSALGLYSFDSNQTIQAAHQRLWLSKAEKLICKEVDISTVTREMSLFLSGFDTLGSQFNIGIADIVFRSLLKASPQPNNVELWVGRVDSA